MDPLALGMKITTFLGVLVAATGMNIPDLRKGLGTRFIAFGVAGVALMVANSWLTDVSVVVAFVVDVAYAAACVALLARAIRVAPRPMTTFTLVRVA